ncbi:SKI family transcriptional corepressor 1 homolog-B-like [Paramacrobiotus metropolitanus]|uniref:SKI family transcriptional corepressor 1 homolog-B-like n=1 Tax=Paramacrobiotus metropolitanus TaxID=2943436 RepID=UPI0024463163|nr:SKI family transcriptional corepressor 1 homolog-B-like [Paramacrobiotus metropolitanus]
MERTFANANSDVPASGDAEKPFAERWVSDEDIRSSAQLDVGCPRASSEDKRGRRSSSNCSSGANSPSPAHDSVPNQIHTVQLFDVPIVALSIDRRLRLCLAQISSTLLKDFSYNEIHNRRVALGINCVQCTPVQLEILRRAGAMPISSRRCGMITKREAERLVRSFLCETKPPALPDDFAFQIAHSCAWGCKGRFMPSRYNSSRAKCIQCVHCQQYFSPNKFIFHSHKLPDSIFSPADAANFNSWRRHIRLMEDIHLPEDIVHAWEDVKAMFNGGSRRRIITASACSTSLPRKCSIGPSRTSHPAIPTVRKITPVDLGTNVSRIPNSPLPLTLAGHYPTPSSVSAPLASSASSSVMPYPSMIHPAASLLQYDWLYRQNGHHNSLLHPGAATNLWSHMQGSVDQGMMWPWSPAHAAAAGLAASIFSDRRADIGSFLSSFRPLPPCPDGTARKDKSSKEP